MREVKPNHSSVGSDSLVDRMRQAFFKAIAFKQSLQGRTAVSTDGDEKVIHKQRSGVLRSPEQII